MNVKLKKVLQRAETWPEWAQEELAAAATDIDAALHGGAYHASPEELGAIDDALSAVERGELATQADVEAVFAKHRRG